MKKSIWNASFEESKKIVTREFMLRCFTGLQNEEYRWYPFYFCVLNIMISLALGGVIVIWEHAILEISVKAHLLQTLLFVLGSIVMLYSPYIIVFLRLRKKKVLSRYYIKAAAVPAIIWACLVAFMGGCAISVVGFHHLGIVLLAIGLTTMILYPFREKHKLITKLYNLEKRTYPIYRWLVKAITVTLIFVIFKLLPLHTGTRDMLEVHGFEFVIVAFLALVIPIVVFLLMIQYAKELLEAFYLAKYYEEYRLLFEFNKEEWYEGQISQERCAQFKGEYDDIISARRKRIVDARNRIGNGGSSNKKG